MKRLSVTVLVATLLCSACQRTPETPATPTPPKAVDVSAQLHVTAWPLPITGGATAPDLHLAPDGRLLLSWISTQPGRRDAVQYAAYDSAHWQSAPKTIAVGTALFTNWADTPHILATPDGALWVHWLQKSTDAQYAYDIAMSTSRDDGMHWSAPFSPHDDGTASEHGFVSMWPAARDTLGIAWLDGRNTTATDAGKNHEGHGGGAMSLRAATYDPRMQRGNDTELDGMTCDCCQTDVAMTTQGPLLVYRGRDHGEIRDILATRFDGNAWTPAHKVHDDQWKMPACPVNGPAVAARDHNAVVAWYTEAGKQPVLKLARSADAGATFAAPIEIDSGAALMGRVDVAFDGRQVVLAWLREDAGGQTLQLARYTPDLSKQLQKLEVAKLQGRGRATGFPKLALRDGIAHLVWTDVVDGRPQLRGAVLAR
jgi:hypothetical protein